MFCGLSFSIDLFIDAVHGVSLVAWRCMQHVVEICLEQYLNKTLFLTSSVVYIAIHEHQDNIVNITSCCQHAYTYFFFNNKAIPAFGLRSGGALVRTT